MESGRKTGVSYHDHFPIIFRALILEISSAKVTARVRQRCQNVVQAIRGRKYLAGEVERCVVTFVGSKLYVEIVTFLAAPTWYP